MSCECDKAKKIARHSTTAAGSAARTQQRFINHPVEIRRGRLGTLLDDRSAVAAIACDGTRVFCAAMIELAAGKITKQTVVQAWDA